MVTPPSTKIKSLRPTVTTSGGKKTGAAVLARTNCHNGKFRLQSFRARSLYLANGLFEIGHGESVVALRIIIINTLRSFGSPSSVVSPSSDFSFLARLSSSYL